MISIITSELDDLSKYYGHMLNDLESFIKANDSVNALECLESLRFTTNNLRRKLSELDDALDEAAVIHAEEARERR